MSVEGPTAEAQIYQCLHGLTGHAALRARGTKIQVDTEENPKGLGLYLLINIRIASQVER